MTSLRRALGHRPILVAMIYTVAGVLPLYVISASSVRLQVELDFGRPQLGLIVAAFYLVSSIASRTQGSVVDRIGPTRGLYIGAVTSVVASVFIVGFASNWQTLAIGAGIAGLSNAFAQLSSNLAVAAHVRHGRQGVGFALKQAAVPTGAMVAGLAVPLGVGAGWQWPFVGAALVGLLSVSLVPRFDHSPTVETDGKRAKFGPPLIALTVAAALGGGLGNSLASFVVDAASTAGYSDTLAPRLLTVGSFTAIAMRTLSGWMADRRQRRGVAELIFLMVLAVVGFGLLSVGASDTGPLFIIGVVIAFAGAWGWPGVMYYVVVHSTRLAAGASTGAVLSGAYLGTVIGPPLMGVVADRTSYSLAFGIAAGLMTGAVAAVVTSQRLYRASLDERAYRRE